MFSLESTKGSLATYHLLSGHKHLPFFFLVNVIRLWGWDSSAKETIRIKNKISFTTSFYRYFIGCYMIGIVQALRTQQ